MLSRLTRLAADPASSATGTSSATISSICRLRRETFSSLDPFLARPGAAPLGSWSFPPSPISPRSEKKSGPLFWCWALTFLMASLINKKGPFYFIIDTLARSVLILSPAVQSKGLRLAATKETTLNLRGVSQAHTLLR